VILEAGIGDFSVEWSLVQPGIAKSARVCSYDRAGDGWSDLGPYPRTMHQLVYELQYLDCRHCHVRHKRRALIRFDRQHLLYTA
jgi:hypothetical protein